MARYLHMHLLSFLTLPVVSLASTIFPIFSYFTYLPIFYLLLFYLHCPLHLFSYPIFYFTYVVPCINYIPYLLLYLSISSPFFSYSAYLPIFPYLSLYFPIFSYLFIYPVPCRNVSGVRVLVSSGAAGRVDPRSAYLHSPNDGTSVGQSDLLPVHPSHCQCESYQESDAQGMLGGWW